MLTTCITSIHDQFIDSRNKCHISEERKEKKIVIHINTVTDNMMHEMTLLSSYVNKYVIL